MHKSRRDWVAKNNHHVNRAKTFRDKKNDYSRNDFKINERKMKKYLTFE